MKSIFTQIAGIIDFKLYLFLIISWILVCIIPATIPDLFRLQYILKNGDILPTMLTIITSLFGILIAFLLLSYGLFKDRYGRIALKYMTEEKNIKFLINLLLLVSIHLFFNYLYLNYDTTISEIDITFTYISIFLFLGSLILLFPISFRALTSPESLVYIENQVKSISKEVVQEFIYHKEIIDSDSAKGFEENGILIVQKLGLSLIKNEDFIGFGLLQRKLNEKHIELIGNSKDRNLIGDYYKTFSGLWISFIDELIKTKHTKYLNFVWIMLEEHHKHFADRRIPILYLEEFDYFIKTFIDRLFNEKEFSCLEYGVRIINKILIYHYQKSLPAQEKLAFLMSLFTNTKIEYDTESDLQWDRIADDIPYYYTIILRNSITSQNESLFFTTLHQINYLIYDALKIKMGDYQKAYIIIDLVSDYFFYQIEAFKQGLINKDYSIKFLDTHIFNQIIADDMVVKKKLFTTIGDFYIEMFRLGKLDFRYLHPNLLAAVGRNCANKYHLGETYKETLNYIIEVFKYFKTEFEKDPKYHNNLYELKLEFISFKNFHIRNTDMLSKEPKPETQIHNDLIIKLDEIINSFTNIEKPQLEMGQAIIKFK